MRVERRFSNERRDLILVNLGKKRNVVEEEWQITPIVSWNHWGKKMEEDIADWKRKHLQLRHWFSRFANRDNETLHHDITRVATRNNRKRKRTMGRRSEEHTRHLVTLSLLFYFLLRMDSDREWAGRTERMSSMERFLPRTKKGTFRSHVCPFCLCFLRIFRDTLVFLFFQRFVRIPYLLCLPSLFRKWRSTR